MSYGQTAIQLRLPLLAELARIIHHEADQVLFGV